MTMTTTPETIRICNFCGELYDSQEPSAVALRELFCRAGCAAAYHHVAEGDPEPILPDAPRRSRPAPRRRPRRRPLERALEPAPVRESAAGPCRCRPDGGGSAPVGEELTYSVVVQLQYNEDTGDWLPEPIPTALYLGCAETRYSVVVVGGTETAAASFGEALQRGQRYWHQHGISSRVDGVLRGQRRTLAVVPERLEHA